MREILKFEAKNEFPYVKTKLLMFLELADGEK
jgi:hypothetical protein